MGDIIVALATPPLKSALAVVRSSGEGVFRLAAVDVPGQHPKHGHEEQDQNDPVQHPQPGEQKHQIQHQVGDHEENIQLIDAVSAHHKAGEKLTNHRYLPPDGSGQRLPYRYSYDNLKSCQRQWGNGKQNVNLTVVRGRKG